MLNVNENNTFWTLLHLFRHAAKTRYSVTSELDFKHLQQEENSVKNSISAKSYSLYILLMLITAVMLLSLILYDSGCTLKKEISPLWFFIS